LSSHEPQEIPIDIPSGYSPDQRREIAELIIDRIVERTMDLKIDKNGRPFDPLKSESYKAFKMSIGAGGEANLRLTGEMLGSLQYKPSKSSSTKIVVGIDASRNAEENAKAKGHITGDIGVKRDFLGLPQSEIDEIVSRFEPESDIIGQAILLRSLSRRLFG
jgi:hypothetical protein